MIKIKGYKKALVTGGAGFIGSHIIEELLKQGIAVVSVDNYFSGKPENLAFAKKYDNFTEAKCDVLDLEGLKKLYKGVDIVFHNAASKKTVCLNDPRLDLDINAKGTFNMLELARDFKVKKFVHASTGSVYGEAQYYPQDEKHPVVPTSNYGVSKLAGEKYAKLFNHLYGLNTSVLRYFHVYGSRQDASEVGGVVSIFIRRLLEGKAPIIFGDGDQQRSFTYVKDVVNANFYMAMDKNTEGEAYNLASGIKVTINELAEKLAKLLNKDIKPEYGPPTPGDIKVFDLDSNKLKALGWKVETEFEDGLKNTIEWTKENFERVKLEGNSSKRIELMDE